MSIQSNFVPSRRNMAPFATLGVVPAEAQVPQPATPIEKIVAQAEQVIPVGKDMYLVGDGNHGNIEVLATVNALLPAYLQAGVKTAFLECTAAQQPSFDALQLGQIDRNAYLHELDPYKGKEGYDLALRQREVLYDFMSTAAKGGAHVYCADPNRSHEPESALSAERREAGEAIDALAGKLGVPQSLIQEANDLGGGTLALDKTVTPWIQQNHPEAVGSFQEALKRSETANAAWLKNRLDDRGVWGFVQDKSAGKPALVMRGDLHMNHVPGATSFGDLTAQHTNNFHYLRVDDPANNGPFAFHDFKVLGGKERAPDVKADVVSGEVVTRQGSTIQNNTTIRSYTALGPS